MSNVGSNDIPEKSKKDKGGTPKMSKAMTTAAKRIQKELGAFSVDPPPNCSAGPTGDNLFEWVSTILGPPGSVYEGHLSLITYQESIVAIEVLIYMIFYYFIFAFAFWICHDL